MRNYSAATGLLTSLIFGVIASAPAAESEERSPDLARAVTLYEAARDKARDELLRSFDLTSNRLAKSGFGAEDRVKLIEVLRAEKERFEKSGLVPWSAPMRPTLLAYQKSLALAETDLRRVYSNRIDRALRAKEIEDANQLQADLTMVLDYKPIAYWRHLGRSRIALFPNGRIGDPEAVHTWSFDGVTLVLRWPNATAPGGAWVDKCAVSVDGSRYEGKNQRGGRITGSYLSE